MDAATDRQTSPIEARLGLFYAAYFAAVGLQTPFLPLWLDWKDLDARQIAMVTAVPMFVRTLVSPLMAFGADRHGDHRSVVIGLAWIGAAAMLALSQSAGFAAIFALMLVFAIVWSTVMPLAETVAMSVVRAKSADYGRMRVWGSVSFIVASFAGGWVIEHTHVATSIWLIAAMICATALAAHRLPERAEVHGEAPPPPRATAAGALALIKSPMFLWFVLAAGAVQASHAIFYVFGVLHWRGQGLSTAWCGALWGLGIVFEIVLFLRAKAVLAVVDPLTLILAGGIAAIVRWGAMAFDPPLGLLVPLQILHAATFAASHLGALHFIAAAVAPGHAGTAQALYGAFAGGLAMGGAMLVAGPAYQAYGGRAYLVMVVLAGLSVAAAVVVRRRWGGAGAHAGVA